MEGEFTQKQLKCINELDTDIIVSAGAGTGKTRVLTHRYINILDRKKTDLKNILCITFTNKASIEMKQRITKILHNKVNGNGQDFGRIESYLTDIEYCQISTIHSFCSNMLREYSIDAGLDPEFTTVEETDALLLKEKILEKILEKYRECEKEVSEQFYKYIKWPSGNPDGLVKSLLQIYDKRT